MQAQGIANAMQIIRGQLSGMYIQHEAIEAQKAMVNSPNHTVVYIPVGPMGVPAHGDDACGTADGADGAADCTGRCQTAEKQVIEVMPAVEDRLLFDSGNSFDQSSA